MTDLPRCMECKHFINNKKFGCKAFKVIPNDIFFNKKEHNKVVENQMGSYVFKPIKKAK